MNVTLVVGSTVGMSGSKFIHRLRQMKSSVVIRDKPDVFVQLEQGDEVSLHAGSVQLNLFRTQFAKIDEEN